MACQTLGREVEFSITKVITYVSVLDTMGIYDKASDSESRGRTFEKKRNVYF